MVGLGGGIGSVLGALIGETLGIKNNPLFKVISTIAGGNQQNQSTILGVVMSVIQNSGGLQPLLNLFNKTGLNSLPESWVSNQPNEEIAPEQVQEVLGNSIISQIASKLGVDSNQATSVIAKVLPELVNQITPEGSISGEQDNAISKAISLLNRL